MRKPQEGDKVHLALGGLEIADVIVREDGQTDIRAVWPTGRGYSISILVPWDPACFSFVEPASWPPEAGDVWECPDGCVGCPGHTWFFYRDLDGTVDGLNLRDEGGAFIDGISRASSGLANETRLRPQDWLLQNHVPLRLVYRRGI